MIELILQNADTAFKESDEVSIKSFPLYIPRAILDLSFFVIVTAVGLGVVFGLIEDTFSELRNEKVSVIL